ncbi:MAG: 16S rRNA (guanine(966)-N(2))-methyltransferase RsmD [Halioglobus sp.]
MTRPRKQRQQTGQLRIIGGQWRGRKLSFVAEEALRPTPDRIRETLFNWLAPDIHDARCADLFAGSGALGLEALSRGAAHCDFVDTSSVAIAQVSSHLQTLDANNRASCHVGTCAHALDTLAGPFDIVFLDPPYSQDLVEPTAQLLDGNNLLAPGALVYIEMATTSEQPAVPDSWHLHREKVGGGVAYRLYTTGGP